MVNDQHQNNARFLQNNTHTAYASEGFEKCTERDREICRHRQLTVQRCVFTDIEEQP